MSLSLQDYRSATGVLKWIEELGVVNATLPREEEPFGREPFGRCLAPIDLDMLDRLRYSFSEIWDAKITAKDRRRFIMPRLPRKEQFDINSV